MINQVDLRIPDFQTNRDNSEYIHWLNMIVPDMIPGLMNAGYHDGDMGIFSSTIFFWIWPRSQLDFHRIPLDLMRFDWLKTLAESYGGHWELMGKSKEKNIRDMGVDL